jgi:hypothetical protein
MIFRCMAGYAVGARIVGIEGDEDVRFRLQILVYKLERSGTIKWCILFQFPHFPSIPR